ncbi:MAG: hypothetical protein LBT02_04440 [Rickettsiales bacterium]|nr:hypothetical protein [Rickettsiales bacterium]
MFIFLPFLAVFNLLVNVRVGKNNNAIVKNKFLYYLTYFKISVSNTTKIQNFLLFVANLLFYAFSDLRMLNFVIPLAFVTFAGGVLIEKIKFKKTTTLFFVLMNTIILSFFKYWKLDGVIAPIGISFIYFKLVSYLVDIYYKKIKATNDFYNFLQYIMFFPQVLMGPIQRYNDFNKELQSRRITFDESIIGVKRFVFGLAKKILIADVLGEVVNKIFALQVVDFNTHIAWLGAIFYTFQLYYDFSGFTDMSIGVAKIFGFNNIPENFDYPYLSKSITEFWRKWHITLGSWFRDYVYIPLGGNKVSKFRMYVNLWIVFLLTGIWHGQGIFSLDILHSGIWIFVVWGIWHGFFNCIEKVTGWNKPKERKIMSAIQHIYCLLVVMFGWVIFRSKDLEYAFDYLKNMFGVLKINSQFANWYYIDRVSLLTLAVAILCSFPVFKKWKEGSNLLINIWIVILLIVSVAFVSANTYQSFLYFQF